MNVAVTGEPGALRTAVEEAVHASGARDAAVHVIFDVRPSPQPLVDIDLDAWDRTCERVLRDALHAAQHAHEMLRERGGRLVFVTPASSLIGAEGFTALTAAAEGVRALMRSAARQWGPEGVTVNTVAVAVDDVPDLVPVLAFLTGAGGATVTGGTFVVDGGNVMLP